MTLQGRAKLSSNVLEMKFMKKSKEKSELEAEEERRKIMFESEIPDALIRGGDLCIIEPSFVPCLQLLNGRFSFKGMNPEIEKLMREDEQKDLDKLKKMDGISDQEMAERYSSLVAIKKKFTSKRKWTAENNDDDDVSCSPERSYADKPLKFRKPKDS
ncbi:M-phase phosphoprotein 6-like [Argiope bruennichi]|uniref:M-phase phosphoprotein 6-like n=1 Tax=Argiope bruennichi TaxID=94029 RepID=UPI00249573B9|nr:M-phase phosphoprotein 6-like [Argiope bruennichi]